MMERVPHADRLPRRRRFDVPGSRRQLVGNAPAHPDCRNAVPIAATTACQRDLPHIVNVATTPAASDTATAKSSAVLILGHFVREPSETPTASVVRTDSSAAELERLTDSASLLLLVRAAMTATVPRSERPAERVSTISAWRHHAAPVKHAPTARVLGAKRQGLPAATVGTFAASVATLNSADPTTTAPIFSA